MGAEPAILVVGSINVDLVVRAERLPRPEETVTGGTFTRHGGGKGANQAVAAARDGAVVRLVGAVGDDAFGDEALGELAEEGVDVTGVRRLEDAATGVALIVVDAAGENQIAVASGANARLDADLVEEALDAAPGPLPGAMLASFEVPDGGIAAAAGRMRDAGVPVVLNPAPARDLGRELADLGPVLVPNRGEAAALTGIDRPERAVVALQERTSAPVVVTLGAEGALLADGDGVRELGAFEAEAVDTTGAGDTFCGVLAAGLARGFPLGTAAVRASAAAALSVRKAGARGGMPRSAEIEALLSGGGPS